MLSRRKIKEDLSHPNSLTLYRILVIPAIVILLFFPNRFSTFLSAIIFSTGAITDWLDGFLARKLKQTSSFGAFLDPVADKLIVVIALVLLVGTHKINYITLPALVIIGREITISSLREWMAEIGKSNNVAVNYIGKLKTCIQFIAIILLFGRDLPHHRAIILSGSILLHIAAILTLWSMVIYLKKAWPSFKFRNEQK